MPIGLEGEHKGIVDLINGKGYLFEGDRGEIVNEVPVPEHLQGLVAQKRSELIERLAEVDDDIAEAFLGEEEIAPEALKEAIRRQTIALKFVPVFMGSVRPPTHLPTHPQPSVFLSPPIHIHAKQQLIQTAFFSSAYLPTHLPIQTQAFKNKGVQRLLDGVLDYLPNPSEVPNYALDLDKEEEKVPVLCEEEMPAVALAFKLEEGKFGE